MANQNIRTPRFYTDLIKYHRARGTSVGSVTATNASNGFVGLPSGSTVDDLLDLRPLNQVTFNTSSDTDGHVLFNANFTTASYKQSYVAILNHNLASSKGKIRLFAGNEDNDNESLDGAAIDVTSPLTDAVWSGITTTEIINADDINVASGSKSVVIEPASDGTTIIQFDEQDLRFWAVQFEGSQTSGGDVNQGAGGTNLWDGSTDFKLGGIMIGEHFDMPQSPDLSLTRSIIYDKVKINESVGGQRYASATSLGRTASSDSKSPFALGTYGQAVYGGRIAYDLNFSFLSSANLLPSETTVYQFSDDTVVSDVWNMTDGPHRPFIFCIDNTSTGNNADSEYMFARFAQDSLDMTQVANDHYNISLRIEEDF